MTSEFSPPGETSYDLWVEKTNLDGLVLSGVAYGALATLFFQCLQLQIHKSYKSFHVKCVWIAYTCALFVLGTFGFAGNTKFVETTYIDNRNYPGGPNAFTAEHYSEPANLLGFNSYTIMSWVADRFLLFRFLVISNCNYVWLIFPTLMFLGSVSCSIALNVAIARSADTFWGVASTKFAIAYWSLSISLNILITLFISLRILRVRATVKTSLGPEAAAMYTSLTAILVESAALYSTWGLIFIISYARGSPVQNLILPALGQVQGIAPLLIILRATSGKGWTQGVTNKSMSQLRAHYSTTGSGSTAISLRHMKASHQGTELNLSKAVVTAAEGDVEVNKSASTNRLE